MRAMTASSDGGGFGRLTATPEGTMRGTSPELDVAVETPAAEPESISPGQLQAAVRDLACRLDPHHCHLYRAMDLDRMLDATRVDTLLLHHHTTYRQRSRAGTGRRQHSRAVFDVLDAVNSVDLVIAQAWATAAIAVFDPDTAADDRVRRPRRPAPDTGT